MRVWERDKDLTEQKTHWRLSPIEALLPKPLGKKGESLTYSDLLKDREGKWKLKEYDETKDKF